MNIITQNIYRRLLPIVSLLLAAVAVHAEPVTANFDSGLPEGWTMTGSLYNDSDRARSGKGIYTYSKQDKTNYIITTEIEGDIEFYGRSYNTKGYGYITFYTVNADNSIGEKLIEFRTNNVTSGPVSFQKFTYTLNVPQRIAIDLFWSCIDDFTYTPAQTAEAPLLSVTGFASGSSFDFGGVPVSAATTHTFTLVNKGDSDLQISSIDVTGGYTITDGASISSIAPKSSADLVIATPAADATGVLTINSNSSEGIYQIHLSSQYKVPRPIMEVATEGIDFGKVTYNVSREVVVSNTGDGLLTVSLSVNNGDFTVIPTSLNVLPGESGRFVVAFNFVAGKYGRYEGVVSLTPNDGEVATIPVSAKIVNPDAWIETFSADGIPSGWEADACWSVANGIAKALYDYNDRNSYLTTPSLKVATGEELTFMYRATSAFVTIKILASENGGPFNTLISIPTDKAMAEFAPYSISGLTPGSYRFRFVNDDYELDDFEGFTLDLNAPIMVVTPVEDAAFGKVTEKPQGRTYEVVNKGTGKMTVNIESDSQYFTVEPSQLTDIEQGRKASFTVNFEYNVEEPDTYTGTITVIPTYNELAKVTFQASAIAKNPAIWEEDFELGTIPEDWENTGEWYVDTPFVSGSNGSRMAVIRSTEPSALTTPRIKAAKGDKLKFDIGMQFDDEPLIIEYSSDKVDWVILDADMEQYTESGTITFEAPYTGYYFIRFTGTYAMLDNFSGFGLAHRLHELVLDDRELPATAQQYLTYTATITVKETYGKIEQATARLFVDGEEVAISEAQEISPMSTSVFTLSFTPACAMDNAEAYIEVNYAEEVLRSDVVLLTIEPAPVWDEGQTNSFENENVPVVVWKYTATPGWNTLAVPFVLTDDLLRQVFGEDFEIYEFSGFSDGMLEFSTPIKYTAGMPYIVYTTKPESNPDGILLTDIHIEAETAGFVEHEGVKFTSFYSPVFSGSHVGDYFVNADKPQLYAAENEDFSKAFRGYFTLSEGIGTVPILKLGDYNWLEIVNNQTDSNTLYNLQGIKVSQPSSKGIYILNGKKVVR